MEERCRRSNLSSQKYHVGTGTWHPCGHQTTNLVVSPQVPSTFLFGKGSLIDLELCHACWGSWPETAGIYLPLSPSFLMLAEITGFCHSLAFNMDLNMDSHT